MWYLRIQGVDDLRIQRFKDLSIWKLQIFVFNDKRIEKVRKRKKTTAKVLPFLYRKKQRTEKSFQQQKFIGKTKISDEYYNQKRKKL